MEERFIVKASTPERLYEKVYHDFLDAELLNGKEQIIYIHLKRYINFANDNGCVQSEVYPALSTLSRKVKMSEKTIRELIQSLNEKGIIKTKQQGCNKPNIYTVNDNDTMWKSKSITELKETVDKSEEEHMIKALMAKGYYISKEKELDTAPSKVKYQAPQTNQINNIVKNEDIINTSKSQAERYELADIKSLFDYDTLLSDYPDQKSDWDTIMDILYEALNTTKPTIRIDGEDKPRSVVIGKLMKLTHYDIEYAVSKFHSQTVKITNVRAYLLTILYHAREQSYLELMNLGHRNGDF